MTTLEAPDTRQPTQFISQEVILPHIVEPAGFQLQSRTLPQPQAGQVVVRVNASGISFAEQSMRRGRYPGQPKFPFTPGYDLVGRIVAVGPDVPPSRLGQRVAALTKTGGWATYVLLAADTLLPVPDGVDAADAEALIVNGITAWQMLHREARVKSGQTILVHGANGGVGTILIQLARHLGVRVIGMASPRHHEALRAQGVEPVDYNRADWPQRVRELAPDGVDAAFDNVGGQSAVRSFRLLKKGGALVCSAIASAINGKTSLLWPFVQLVGRILWWKLMPNGRRADFYNIWAGKGSPRFKATMQQDFGQLMALVEAGVLTPPIAATFPLAQIREAMTLAESRTLYGKVIIRPDAADVVVG